MQRAEEAAREDTGEQGRRREDGQYEADPGALAHAPLAELVGLDLALVVQDEDTDGVQLDVIVGLVPGLQRRDRGVGGCLVLEHRQYELLLTRARSSAGLVGGSRPPPAVHRRP